MILDWGQIGESLTFWVSPNHPSRFPLSSALFPSFLPLSHYTETSEPHLFYQNPLSFSSLNPPVAKKTISKPSGGAGRLCREVAAQRGGYFPKSLQRHLWKLATCVFRQNRGFSQSKILRNPTFSKNPQLQGFGSTPARV